MFSAIILLYLEEVKWYNIYNFCFIITYTDVYW